MSIFDCFQYFNEEHIVDLRLNILDEFVDKFVIVESTLNHQGKNKKLHFDINKFSKFKDKINYIIVDDTPENYRIPHEGGESLVEQHQRNSIARGLKNALDDDIIILSDVDEIPDLHKLSQFNKKNYAVFSQKMFMYKINLLNLEENNWHGSKICTKKNFKSPQWLRDRRFTRRGFLRKFLFRTQFIENGGWHFSFLKSPADIVKKLNSYAHSEFSIFGDPDFIKENIEKRKFFIDPNRELIKVPINEMFPNYIRFNKEKYSEWII